jgi:glycosyltransferase involved in cell wall biosynthesis
MVERLVFRLSHAITANARAIQDELTEEGASPTKIALIYNGIDMPVESDPENCREKVLSGTGVSSEVLIITVVANLIGYKGHLDLLAAINKVRDRLPPWRLMCVGRDDGAGNELRQEAQRLGISDKVSLLGLRSDVNALLSASDIVVLPSHEEGFPNALIEAMAAGRPVVSTNVGGSAEAVEHGVTGLLVPAHDPSAMSLAILDLAMNPKKRADLGGRAREGLREKYDVDLAVRRHEFLYRAILAGERRFSEVDQNSLTPEA